MADSGKPDAMRATSSSVTGRGVTLCRCLADDLRGRSAHEHKPEPGVWFLINGIFNVIAYLLIV
jgi:hypothetical protein